MKEISALHYITQDGIEGFSHGELARKACLGGMRWVQLRVKRKIDFDEWVSVGEQVKRICQRFHAKLIINDSVEVAKTIRADGVHLGDNDMDPLTARMFLGEDAIIGGTANTLERALQLAEMGVDYIGVGPYKHTETKVNLAPVLGPDGIKEIADRVRSVPLIVIGGIIPDDIMDIMPLGVHGVAFSSAVNKAEDKKAAADNFAETMKLWKKKYEL